MVHIVDNDFTEFRQSFNNLCDQLLKLNKSKYQAGPKCIDRFKKSNLNLTDFITEFDKEFTVPKFNRVNVRDDYYRKRCANC